MKKVVVCLMLVGLMNVQVAAIQPAQTKTFTMVFALAPDNQPLFKFAELFYIEAFQRLGMEFAYKVYPNKRCGVLANAGEVDGEPGRTNAYNQTFPNLIRVEEPILEMRQVAFAVDPSIRLDGWESLRGTTYNVETMIGNRITEHELPGVVAPGRFSTIATIEQGLKKLRAGRTDIYIDNEVMVDTVLYMEEFRDSGIVQVGVLQDMSMHPFLHKKHAALAPKLADVIKQMKAEGLVEQYQQQAEEFFQPK